MLWILLNKKKRLSNTIAIYPEVILKELWKNFAYINWGKSRFVFIWANFNSYIKAINYLYFFIIIYII